MSRERPNHMAMQDFTRMADAKSFALTLMDEGVQFTCCPEPLSISYPIHARVQKLQEQPATNA